MCSTLPQTSLRTHPGFLSLALLLSLATALPAQEHWPQFRGPGSRGIGQGPTLPQRWSASENIVWRTPLPGRGWSSPIVWEDRVFVTTAGSEQKPPTPRKGLYFGGESNKPPAETYRWLVLCLDRHTGKVLWEREAHKGQPQHTIHTKNSYASETPVTDGERVYAYFGNVGVFCYALDGTPQWSVRFEPVKTRFGWGPAASPVLHQDRLYIVNDNEEQSYLLALDKRTGKQVWRVPREEKSNWATPYIWENPQRTEIITAGTNRVRSYDLDGKLLWEFSGMSTITIPTPFSAFGLLYVGSGYVLDKLRPIYAVRPGASGDISLADDQTHNEFIAWSRRDAGPYNPSFLVYGDYCYVLYDRGFFGCFDARTGKPLYERQRIGAGATAFTASPWAYNGKIFCLSEDGVTYVFQAGPQYQLLGQNALDELSMATPAIAQGSLFLRTDAALYRIEQPQ